MIIKQLKGKVMFRLILLGITLCIIMLLISCDNTNLDTEYEQLSATFLSYPDESQISTLTLEVHSLDSVMYAWGRVRIKNTCNTGIDFWGVDVEDLHNSLNYGLTENYIYPSEIVGPQQVSDVFVDISNVENVPSGTYWGTLVLRGCEYSNGSSFGNNTIIKSLLLKFVKT